MSNLASPRRIEAKVNIEMEKFLLRQNTSQRQLLSKISSIIVNNELVYLQKFKKPKKLVIPGFKTPMMVNVEDPTNKSLPIEELSKKFSRAAKSPLTSPPSANGKYTPMAFTMSSINLNSPKTAKENLIGRYNELLKSISASPKKRSLKFRKLKRKINKICRNADLIGTQRNLEDEITSKRIERFNKEHEKKYLKETVKEMRIHREADVLQLLRMKSPSGKR